MKVELTITSKDLDNLTKRLNTLADYNLQVGFFENAVYGPENDNLQVAAVVTWQEFGDPVFNVNYPPRPFMRVDFVNHLKSGSFKQQAAEVFKDVILNKSATKTTLSKVGKNLAKDLTKIIYDYDTIPNAASTAAQKTRGNDPLVDTEKMANSTDFRLTRGKVKDD